MQVTPIGTLHRSMAPNLLPISESIVLATGPGVAEIDVETGISSDLIPPADWPYYGSAIYAGDEGRFWLAGGVDPSTWTTLNITREFDLETGKPLRSLPLSDLGRQRRGLGAVALPRNRVALVCGTNEMARYQREAIIHDIESGEMAVKPTTELYGSRLGLVRQGKAILAFGTGEARMYRLSVEDGVEAIQVAGLDEVRQVAVALCGGLPTLFGGEVRGGASANAVTISTLVTGEPMAIVETIFAEPFVAAGACSIGQSALVVGGSNPRKPGSAVERQILSVTR